MDRFLDEMENQANNRERPTSPINSLLLTDHKRQSPTSHSPINKTPTPEDLAAMVELMQSAPVEFATTLTELAPDLAAAAAASAAAAGAIEPRPCVTSTPLKSSTPSSSPVTAVVVDLAAAGDGATSTSQDSSVPSSSDEPLAKRPKFAFTGDAPAADVTINAAEVTSRTGTVEQEFENNVQKHEPDSAGDHADVKQATCVDGPCVDSTSEADAVHVSSTCEQAQPS